MLNVDIGTREASWPYAQYINIAVGDRADNKDTMSYVAVHTI